jgi:hypothetical protein
VNLNGDFVFVQELYAFDFETTDLLLKEYKRLDEDEEASEAVLQGIGAMFHDTSAPFRFLQEPQDKAFLK